MCNTQIDIIQNGVSSTVLNLCDGENYTLVSDDIPGATYTWTQDGNVISETDFDLVVDQNGLYEVSIDQNNGDCPIEGQAFVTLFDIPFANQPNDIIICDDDNDGAFELNLNIQNLDVLGSQSITDFSVHYYESLIDAQNDQNEILGAYENISNPQQIYVRVKNAGYDVCTDPNSITSFNIEIFSTPIANSVEDFETCDDDLDGNYSNGQKTIDLSQFDNVVLNGQTDTNFSISYHSTLTDAENGLNALPLSYYNYNPFTQQIYIRIQNDLNPDCNDITSFNLIINPRPDAFNATLFQCDEDGLPDGFTIFNLDEAIPDLINGVTGLLTKYYASLVDAQNDVNAINGSSFSNYLNPQIIYVRVINDTTGCYNISELSLEVSATDANDANLQICDDDGVEDGFAMFTLSNAEPDVLNGLPSNLDVSYFLTYEDALLETNPLPISFTNTIPYSQTIYTRVENENACYGINEIQLTVFELPKIETEFSTIYCLNTFPDPITLNGGILEGSPNDYLYSWNTGEISSEIEIDQSGTYVVTVTNANGCSKTRTIEVLPSNIATIENIEVNDVSSNNTISISVSGEGDYEFSLDEINGPYSDSNFFENVAAGIHTLYVRDKNGCGIVEDMVSVIGFPQFFTPNNDGYNDTWQIKGVNQQFQPGSIIYIFDRYGKLVKQLNPTGPGWDGLFNGNPLPNDDYWFAVTLQDGRVFKDHFTLKR